MKIKQVPLFVQIIEAMTRCPSALGCNGKSSRDRTWKLSFRDKHNREKFHRGAEGGKGTAWVRHFHQPNVLIPISFILEPPGWVAAASHYTHALGGHVGVGLRRTTDGLNHIFLSQQMPKGQEFAPSYQRSCKYVLTWCLFLWKTKTYQVVSI